jgi:hypothetical protein
MKEVMHVDQALEVLNLEEIPGTIREVIEIAHEKWANGLFREEIQEARTSIIRHMAQEEMRVRRYFDLGNPVEDSCPKCHGVGELFYFHDKTVKVTCRICGGRGEVKLKCPSCENGRYITEMAGGGVKINVQCNKCHGEGTRFFKCSNCRGAGEVKKVVKDHNLKNTTECNKCTKGMGFIKPVVPEPIVEQKIVEKEIERLKQEKSLLNNVISEEMRDQLMARTVNKS